MKIYVCYPTGVNGFAGRCRIFGISCLGERPSPEWTPYAVLEFTPPDGFWEALLQDVVIKRNFEGYSDCTFATQIHSSAMCVVHDLKWFLDLPDYCLVPYVSTEEVWYGGECVEITRRPVEARVRDL